MAPCSLLTQGESNLAMVDEQSRPALARGVRLQTDAKSGEPVLLFPEGILYLSETAQQIVARCDGRSTAEAIIASLAVEYEVDRATLREDVFECLVDLYERKLLVF
ncbi:MAG TPA: pyrroloquinoline quinone biosynthesis peptide chaperone PqqD [Verrucomicrobiae bacterium]|nr:pyrroloquinoline quinone biosynthesis peptide chaperone PqqD [Verrucomicrobiae bacterium]